MTNLIHEVRAAIPLDQPVDDLCGDECKGCSVKLIEFVSAELETWEHKINEGVTPNLGELDKLAKTCRKVHAILEKNGVV